MASTKVFSLEGRGLKLDTAADVEEHIADLKSNNDVEEVRLQGNTLGVEACEALAKVFETKKKLQVANIADVFTSRLLHEIPPALSALLTSFLTLPNLHTVYLSDNAFGLNTQAPLVAFLSEHTPLRHLILNNNGLGPRAGVLIADALTALHVKKESARKEGKDIPNLETVVCGRNRLENGSMEAWAKAFAAHTGILEVKMVQNGIRQEGIAHLLREGLRHAQSLKVLDLQDNTFTIKGSRALAEVIPGWTELRECGVGDCLLSAKGGIVVADALNKGKNQQLEILRLQYNDIDGKGVGTFGKAAATALPKLRRIELNGNKFNEEDPSVETIRELLQQRKLKVNDETDYNEENGWGMDDLSDLEDESDDEDEDEDSDEEAKSDKDALKIDDEDADEEKKEVEAKADHILKDADQAENENVPLEKDKDVDSLAEQLEHSGLGK